MNNDQEKQPLGASPGPPSEEYIPFGPEWAKQMNQFPKTALIGLLRKALLHGQKYDPDRKTNAKSFAEAEIDILLKLHPTDDDPPIIKDFIPEILALVDKFGKSGQSGGSAPYTASAIADSVKKLCLFKPICDITGDDSEWGTGMSGYGQNKRCSALFKNNSDGKCYYLDAISFKTGNSSWSTEHVKLPDGSTIGSRQYVKSFPWKPKTFYINVIETEVAKDDWEFSIEDVAQLDEVWAYYDRYYHNLKA